MATTFTVGDVQFDTTATPPAIVHGYNKTTRDALTDDTLIKVRTLVIKSNLSSKLTKGLQVTTYSPSDLKDPNNFFNFVSQWESVIRRRHEAVRIRLGKLPDSVRYSFWHS